MGNYKKKKRITFKGLLLRGTAAVIIMTVIFACAVYGYYAYDEKNECTRNKNDMFEDYQDHLADKKFESQEELEDYLGKMFTEDRMHYITGTEVRYMGRGFISSAFYNDTYHYAVVLADKDGSVLASSALYMNLFIDEKGKPDYESLNYFCFNDYPDVPEVSAMFKKCSEMELLRLEHNDYYLKAEFDSIYLDMERGRFVPRKGKLELLDMDLTGDDQRNGSTHRQYDIVDEYSIDILLTDSRYELVTPEVFRNNSDYDFNTGDDPVFNAWVGGEPDKFMDMLMDPEQRHRGYYSDWNSAKSEFIIDGKRYDMYAKVYYPSNTEMQRAFILVNTIPFFILASIIMLLWCWRKNVRNKAKYRFEDFQKNITDYLITSISGPVEAIEKCTKDLTGNNVIIGEEKEKYEAIIENVKAVDKIVSEALFYNNMDRIRKKTDEEKQLEKNIPAELVKNIL